MSESYSSEKDRTSVNWDKLFMYLFIRMNHGWASPFFYANKWMELIMDDTINFTVKINGDSEWGDDVDLKITKHTYAGFGYKHMYKQIPNGRIECYCAGNYNEEHYRLLIKRLKRRHSTGHENADPWKDLMDVYIRWNPEEKAEIEKSFKCDITKADLSLLNDTSEVTHFIDMAVSGNGWAYQVIHNIALAQALVAFAFLLSSDDGDGSC